MLVGLALGGMLTTTGILLGYWDYEISGRLTQIDLDSRWTERVQAVAGAAVWSGILVAALAVHAWMTAPREDR